MMYIRFPPSPRQVEDPLHERGIDIRHDTTTVYGGVQGPGGAGSAAGRQDDPGARGQAQGASEPGEHMEAPGGRRSWRDKNDGRGVSG